MDALDDCSATTSYGRPTRRAASASAIRSCAAPSTRRRRGGWRLLAHERSAQALAGTGASALERAHHVERSARRGDAAAVAVLRDAAEEVGARAPASAARLYAAALRLLGPSAPDRAGLLARRPGARRRGSVARRVRRDAREPGVAAGDAAALRVRLTAGCAALENILGHHHEAHARLQAALAELPARSPPEAVALMLEIGSDGLYRMDYAAMRDWSGRALVAARALGDSRLIASAAGGLAVAGAFDGAIAEAEAASTEGAGVVDAMPDTRPRAAWTSGSTRSPAPRCCSTATRRAARTPSARSPSPRPPARARPCRSCSGRAPCGRCAVSCGRRPKSRHRDRDRARRRPRAGHGVEPVRALVHRDGGRRHGHRAGHGARGRGRAARDGAQLPVAGTGHALAAALLADGDAAGAVEALLDAGGGEELPRIGGVWRARRSSC